MSEGPQWYVSVEGQQHGPYSGEQLVSFTQSGNITRESMVWTDGMAEWLPAARIEGLFAAAAPAPAPVLVRPATAGTGFMHPGQPTAPAAAPHQGGFPHPSIAPASFGLFAGTIATGLVLTVIAIVLMPRAAAQAETNPTLTFILLGLVGVGILCLVIAQILQLMTLHRAWKCLSLAGATVSPGAAVGLLFVPFYNLYWIFRAYHGLSREWNHITSAYDETRAAPRMPEGLFLAYCITSLVFAPVALILAFPVMSAMCRAVNFIAFRPVQQTGGFRFR